MTQFNPQGTALMDSQQMRRPFAPVFERLHEFAIGMPFASALVIPRRRLFPSFGYTYRRVRFEQLWRDVEAVSAGLQQQGIKPGMRLALMVPFGRDMITLVFALLRVGAVQILIDPALGRSSMLDCLQSVEPDGIIGIGRAHLARWLFRDKFPKCRINISVGLPWPRPTLQDLHQSLGTSFTETALSEEDPAAIIFTSGSTGAPKGVLYTHGTFHAQVELIQQRYSIEPGGCDLACFPLFGLFNAAMGTTTVIPDMNPARPAAASPKRLIHHIHDLQINQSFASPAIWNNIGRYCERNRRRLPSMRRILAAGAPVAPHILQRMRRAVPQACEMYTPYGATEALPVASISSAEILRETALLTEQGKGICVGSRFEGIDWKVIAISDEPIGNMSEVEELACGEIGELIVTGPQVTKLYVAPRSANAIHKIRDGGQVWHRMGDVGYFDERDRFWFCGRKSHRVQTPLGTKFTIPCEAILNQHPALFRSALVGVGKPGVEVPYFVAEPWPESWPSSLHQANLLRHELAERAAKNSLTCDIPAARIFLRRSLPVDVRHNAKIFREQLRDWVAAQTTEK